MPPSPSAGYTHAMTDAAIHSAPRAFHVLTKPIGPICNLDCSYCFYLEKEKLYKDERQWRMSDELLEEYIRQYIAAQPGHEVHFAWQGGEPTLLGVRFFQQAVELQRKHALGKTISNALQTNGTLLNDEWCDFFSRNQFLVGLSIDGPRELHDKYRVDKRGLPTFDAVVKGLHFLQKHGTRFNTLTVINRTNASHRLEVYRFLKNIGSGFLQFIPLVERQSNVQLKVLGFDFAHPPSPGQPHDPASPVTEWSVTAEQYGAFLCTIFDEWVHHDVGRTFVQLFDVALSNWMGLGSPLCVFAEKCGAAVAIEHNGDLYSCDHYVYPQYRLGNLRENDLGEMVRSPQQRKFGDDKSDSLPRYCRECTVRFACNGECPKHRFIQTPDGEDGLNYLCAAYKRFFMYIDPYMRVMAELLRRNQPAANIMNMLHADAPEQARRVSSRSPSAGPGRNDPCPCGSGRKFKKCCGAASSPPSGTSTR